MGASLMERRDFDHLTLRRPRSGAATVDEPHYASAGPERRHGSFLCEAVHPVGVEVAVGAERTEPKDGLRSLKVPVR